MTSVIANLLFSGQSAINPIWYLALALGMAVIPLVLGLFTSFVKISVILGMVRNALGTQHTPGNLVTLALSLSLTAYTMLPVLKDSVAGLPALEPEKIMGMEVEKMKEAFYPAFSPWENFIRKNTGEREKLVLRESLKVPVEEDSIGILLPGFLLSELKEAFAMAFAILLPCLVIDLIVANLLMGLGMMMVSPTLISLPLKLLLFVATDAWLLITKGIVNSYNLGG